MNQWLKAENLASAKMEKGDAYIMLGGTYYAGGENTTTDETRPMHDLFLTRGVIRTEEHRYLLHAKEEVLSLSLECSKRWVSTCQGLILVLLTFSLL